MANVLPLPFYGGILEDAWLTEQMAVEKTHLIETPTPAVSPFKAIPRITEDGKMASARDERERH